MRILLNCTIVLGLTLSGCQAAPAGDKTPLEVTASPAQGETNMAPSPTPAALGPNNLIQEVKADLAGRLALPEDEISVVEVTEVEWSDSSLDCPQPGMGYLQVITPGYRILIQAGGQIYEYHTNRDAYFVYCENEDPPLAPKP